MCVCMHIFIHTHAYKYMCVNQHAVLKHAQPEGSELVALCAGRYMCRGHEVNCSRRREHLRAIAIQIAAVTALSEA